MNTFYLLLSKLSILLIFFLTNRVLSSGLEINEFKHLFLSGGFANYINVDNAKKIGFLIDTPNANILKIGNSALNGAIIFLVNVDERIKIESIVKTIKHVELETDVNFFDHFVEGCQFKELKVM